MSKTYLKWGDGNSKVAKLAKRFGGKALTFDIPAYKSKDGFTTCPSAGACVGPCYAKQGAYMFGPVQKAFEFNLAFLRKNMRSFARAAISDLAKIRNVKLVRLHSSGDLFSQEYLDAWVKIAKAYPGIQFYAYTKMVRLDFSNIPDNFAITFSQGGLYDSEIDLSKPHSRIFATDYQRRKAGYADGSKTDLLAIKGEIKIGLTYHGTKNLTPAQAKYFSGDEKK